MKPDRIKQESVIVNSAFWIGKNLRGLKTAEVNTGLQVTGLVQKRFYQQQWTGTHKLTACLMAGIGPVPMMEGSTPTCDHETIFAKGVSPRRPASDFFIRITAAAPSFIPIKYECLDFK